MDKELYKPSETDLGFPLAAAVKDVQIRKEQLKVAKAYYNASIIVEPNVAGTDLEEANKVRLERLNMVQTLAEELLDAEVALGKEISELPASQGKRTDLEPLPNGEEMLSKKETIKKIGLSLTQAQRYETLAANPEIVYKIKKKARKAQEIVSQTSVLQAISETKKKQPYIINNSHDAEWYTPSQYIESARLVMGSIDLDPASCDYANRTVKATRFFTIEDNGLEQEWEGNIWLNPPYKDVHKFIDKLIDEGEYSQAIVLVNNATETRWFKKLAQAASAIVFHTGRLPFDKHDGDSSKPMQGQAFVYLGDNIPQFVMEFSKYGWSVLINPDAPMWADLYEQSENKEFFWKKYHKWYG